MCRGNGALAASMPRNGKTGQQPVLPLVFILPFLSSWFFCLRLGGTPRPTFYLCPVYGWYVLGLRCVRDITARNNSIRYPTTTSPNRNITARTDSIRYSTNTSPHRNITARINSIRSTNVNCYGHIEQPSGKPPRWRQTACHRRKSFKFPICASYPNKSSIIRSIF